jgi:DNA-binding NtrC family response regulator
MVERRVWKAGELRVLAVDDEPDVRLGLRILAESTGAEVRVAGSAEDALETIGRWVPHVVLSDITMGVMSGLDLLAQLRRSHPEIRVVLITGFGTIETAVAAMHRGASHFLTKPFDNEEILDALRRFGEEALIEERMQALGPTGGELTLIARDPAMGPVLKLVERVAPTAMNVLIQGESGVGKELVARAIHQRGQGRNLPFLAVNTAALPDALLESELFGHKKGSFTGADRDRKGIFEQAAGGTVLLDEIGLMSPSFQGKLLRVLQERTVVPLGTSQPVPVEFRLVAATSQNLRERMEKGEFREDLYYRLRVVTVDIPPLRERPADIPPLAAHFVTQYAPGVAALHASTPRLGADALEELRHHKWPGNVRELENCIQRALVLARDGEILPEHLGLREDEPAWRPAVADGISYEEAKQRAVEEFQRRFIERALTECEGNVSRAARICGLTRAALQRIMKSLNLDRTTFVPR